ncbi:MAG TPA: bifunctional adenosylcobinamide kinase/adenosylcobinamide-phosphate guanylyltransferase [Firmicutes bacterium]|nr:bifunctional adenosylcobinamide kinase/adenosylcobinamide-phosphate guanylyltransferase [Bacillota bacterium]
MVLITGGARSGKSRLAEELALAGDGPACYIATAAVLDGEMEHRVARHRARRPEGWSTVEETLQLGAALERVPGETATVILDCLILWLTNKLLSEYREGMTEEEIDRLEEQIQRELTAFCAAVRTKPYRTIVVTNEVGWGVVPDTPMGRVFRDLAGRANQLMARAADSVWLAVAGYPLRIKPPGKDEHT